MVDLAAGTLERQLSAHIYTIVYFIGMCDGRDLGWTLSCYSFSGGNPLAETQARPRAIQPNGYAQPDIPNLSATRNRRRNFAHGRALIYRCISYWLADRLELRHSLGGGYIAGRRVRSKHIHSGLVDRRYCRMVRGSARLNPRFARQAFHPSSKTALAPAQRGARP